MRCNKTIKNFIALLTLVLFLSVQITPVTYAQNSSAADSLNVISSSNQDINKFQPVNAGSLTFNSNSKTVSVLTSKGTQQIASQNVLVLNPNAKNSNAVVAQSIKNTEVKNTKPTSQTISDIAAQLPKTTASQNTSSNPNTLIVTTQRIKDLAVTTAKLANGSVTTQKLADLAVTTQKIADLAVTSSKLADGSITGDKIADGSISLSKLSQLSITADQIVNYTITAEKLANKSVNSFALDDYSVITSKIGTQAITADKLADNSILTNAIGNGAITTNKILDNAVTGAKIQLGADAVGDIMYYDGTDYVRLPAGINGQVLGLTGGIPSWEDTTSPISSLTGAITTNTIDNTNFTQTWNWSTATTENALELGASALTAGSILRISSDSTSLNSTRGLLDVANTGSSTSGVVARIQANNSADSGLTVFADGRIGINANTTGTTLALKQNANGNVLLNAQRATDVAPSGDFITYWNAAGDTVLYRVDNSGNVYAGGITNSNSITITSTSAPQLRVQYDGGNENTNSVSSAGVTTFGFNGTTPQGLFVPQSNRTDTFQFLTAGGLATVLNVDTQNQRVGVGTDTPASTFSVGTTSQFQVDSNGNVIANTINASGTLTLTGLSPSSMVFTDASSNLITATMSGDATITTGGVFTISNNAITTGKILDQNVTTAKIADLNITTQKIADGAVTAIKLATDAVETVKIKDLNVTTAKIDDLAITAGKLAADSVITAKILDSNVTTAKLADFAVTAIKLATDAVTTIKIQDGAVTTPKIADLNVTTQKIANNAVDGTKIQLGSDANGDMMYYNGTDYIRLPIGSGSQVLMVNSGVPMWGAGTSPISALTPAVASNSIDNTIYTQTWNWGGMGSGSALSIGITGTSAADNTALNLTTSSTGTNAYALRVNDDGTYADSTPFIVDVSGNVGIGTTSAAQKLTVAGTGSFTGNVGIGTTPDVTAPLNISSAFSSYITVKLNSSHVAGGVGFHESNALRGYVGYVGGSTIFPSGEIADAMVLHGNTALQFGVNSSPRITILNNGNVGVGTTSPSGYFSVGSSSQFQVNSSGAISAATGISSSGTINFSGLTASKVVFTDASKNLTSTGTVGVDQGGTGTTGLTGIVIGNGASAFTATTLSSGIATQISDETGTGALVFGTTPVFTTNISTPAIISSGALTVTPAAGQNLNVSLSGAGDFVVNSNQFVVDTSAGNVGIGTTTPAYALHVVANAPGSVPLAVQNTNDTGFSSMRYFDDAGVQRMSVGYGNANATAAVYREKAYIITYQANPLLIVTNSAERMRVTETGTVGIGTQTPGAQLEVKTAASGTVGLIVGGTTGQTGDLQQWKDANANTKLAIDASGALYQTPSMVFNTSTLDPNDATSHLFAIKNSPTIQFNPNAYSASDSFVANQFSPVFDMTGARASGVNFGYNTLYALYTDPAENQDMTNMDLRSLYGYVSHAGNVTLGTATGVAGRVNNTGSGAITNARSLWARNVNNTGGGTIGTAYGLYLDNQTAGTTNYSIYSAGGQSYFAGNFAIGTTTMNNGSKFDVQAPNATTASGNNIAFIESSDSQAGDKGGSLGFGGQVASGVVGAFASIAGRKENGTPGSPSGYLQLSSQTSAGVMTEAMRINSFSNVGIGVSGSGILRRVDIRNASGQSGSLTLMNNDFLINSTGTSMQFSSGAATGDTYYRMQVNNGGQASGGNLVINDFGGNVGIGTSTPTTFKLEVSGNVGPASDNANNLGSALKRYANVYATTFNGNITPTGFTQGSVVFAGSGGTLSQNNGKFFWDDTNGRLGIGTNSPTTTNGGLDIASGGIGLIVGADGSNTTRTNGATKEARIGVPHATNAEEPLAIIVASSSAGANNVVIGGGTSSMNTATTLFFSTAANTTTTTGSTRMLIDSSGNVGIGIGTNAPSSRLQISAAANAENMTLGSGAAVGLTVSNDNRLYGINFGVGASGKGWIQAGRVDGTATAYDLSLQASGGNVGIGTTTAGAKLDVSEVATGQTANRMIFESSNPGSTFNTTAGALTTWTGYFNNTATRSTGANQLTNVGLYASASGAQLNYAAIFDQGNVGIGTSAPGGKLHIADDTGGHLRLSRTSMTDRAITISAADNLVFGTWASPNQLIIDNTGKVGIGTTTPDSNLHISASSNSVYNLHISNGGGTATGMLITGGNSGSDASLLRIADNLNTTPFFVVTDGNVGVGTATPSTGKLQINTGAASNNALTLQASSQTSRTYGLGIDSSANFSIYDNTDAVARMVIDSTGEVGFGTTTPSAGVENYGTTQLTAAMTDAGARGSVLALNGNVATAGSGGAITFGNAQSVTAGSLGYAAIKGLLTNGGTNTVGDLAFSTRAVTTDTALTERMRIVGTTGNVGIGNSAPFAPLHVGAGNNLPIIDGAGVSLNPQVLNVQTSAGAAAYGVGINDGTNNRRVGLFVDQANGLAGISTAYSTGGLPFVFRNAGGERLRILDSGNIGIGTTTPSSPLHVEKGIAGGYVSTFTNTDTGTSSNGLRVEVSNNNANNTVQRWFVSGSEIMRVQANGKVGIGTAGPTATLEVASGGFSAQLEGTTLMFTRNTGPSYIAANQTNGYLAFVTNGRAQSEANSNFVLKSDLNSYFNGDVGIGTSTPTRSLQINAATDAFSVYSSGVLNNSTSSAPSFLSPKNTVGLFIGSGTNAAPAESTTGYTANESSGNIRFNGAGVGWGDFGYYPNGNVSGEYGAFRFSVTGTTIDTVPDAKVGMGSVYVAGSAGIGTTSPANKLHVYTASGEVMSSVDANGNAPITMLANSAADPAIYTKTGSALRFGTTTNGLASSGFAEAMRIQGGNTGLGDINPTVAKLSVVSGTGDQLSLNGTGTANTVLRFRDDGTETGAIYTLNGETTMRVRAAGALYLDGGGTSNGALTVLANNNVGVGTTSPNNVFDVVTGAAAGYGNYAQIRTSGSTAYRGGLLLTNVPTTVAGATSFKMSSSFNNGSSANAQFGFVANNDADTFLNSGAALEFQYNGNVILAGQGTGNVGIGMNSPGTVKLNVREDVNGDGDIVLSNPNTGTAARAIMSFNSDSASGLISATSGAYTGVSGWADSMVLQTSAATSGGLVIYSANAGIRFQNSGGTDAMILASGNLALGPAVASSRFHVSESNTATSTANGITIEQSGTGDASMHFLLTSSTRYTMGIDNSDSDKFKIGTSGDLNSGNLLTLTSGGYMGLGTAAPAKKLEIVDSGLKISGTNAIEGSPNNARFIVDSGASTSHVLADLRNSNGSTLWVGGRDIGVGTVNPSAKLDVSDVITAQTANRITFESSNPGSTFNTTAGALTAWAGYFNNTATRSTGANALTNVGLYASASGAQNNYAAIFESGSVGIGTTSPQKTFHIQTPSGDLAYTSDSNANYLQFGNGTFSGAKDVRFTSPNAGINLLTLSSSGNVGIGTTAPVTKLQVVQGTTDLGTVSNSAGGTTITGVGTQFQNIFKVGDTITMTSDGETQVISAIASNTSMTTVLPWVSAHTNAAYSLSGGTRLAVLGNGNVGIGTATPSANLEVASSLGQNPAFRISDADVALPDYSGTVFSPGLSANTIGQWASYSGTTGGVQLAGFTAGGSNTGTPFALVGYHGGSTPTTAAINLVGYKHNGGNNRTALGSSELILQVSNTIGNPLMTVLGGGNVGIGATNPGAKLEVTGTTRMSYDASNYTTFTPQSNGNIFIASTGGGIYASNGSTNNYFFAYDGINNRYSYVSGTGLAVTDGGVNRAFFPYSGSSYINNGSNFGIGITTPGATLDTNGTIRTISANVPASGSGLEMSYTGGSGEILAYNRSGAAYLPLRLRGNGLKLYNGSSVGIDVDGTTGNVGIGTTAPSVALVVNSSSANTARMLRSFTSGNATLSAAVGRLEFGTTDSSTYAEYIGANVTAVATEAWTAASARGTALTFSTTANTTTTTTERMRIDHNGNVGINTTSPSSTNGGLDISSSALTLVLGADGNGTTSRTNTTAKSARIGAYHYTNAEEPMAMIFGNPGDLFNSLSIGGGTSLMNAATAIDFFTAINTTTTTGTLRMSIAANGNVGIGGGITTGSATAPLEVKNNTATTAANYLSQFYNTASSLTSTGGGVNIRIDATTGTGWPLMFSKASGTAMQGVSCNYATNTCSIATPSDVRLKQNINETSYSLESVMNIQVRDYEYTYDSTHTRQTGFLAQQLATVFPDAVYVGSSSASIAAGDLKNTWSVDYTRVVPLLTKAIQDIGNITSTFRTNLIAWFGNVENGITDFYAKTVKGDKVETKELCIDDVCVTRDELMKLKSMQVNADNGNGGGGTPTPPPTDGGAPSGDGSGSGTGDNSGTPSGDSGSTGDTGTPSGDTGTGDSGSQPSGDTGSGSGTTGTTGGDSGSTTGGSGDSGSTGGDTGATPTPPTQ
ncbi:MAG TPA: tail fiber domain-containing protein [Candidatus Paceibacterota bacterium]